MHSSTWFKLCSRLAFCVSFFLAALFAVLLFGQAEPKTRKPELSKSELSERFKSIAKKYGAEPGKSFETAFTYKAWENRFGHLTRPWETSARTVSGKFWFGKNSFYSSEKLTRGSMNQERKTAFENGKLFRMTDERPTSLTTKDNQDFMRESCRYTPIMLMRHIVELLNKKELKNEAEANRLELKNLENGFSVSGSHGDEKYTIELEDDQVTRINWFRNHEMYGDQTITLEYSKTKTGGFEPAPIAAYSPTLWMITYPSVIKESTFGVRLFQLEILEPRVPQDRPKIKVPTEFEIKPEPKVKELIEIDKFSDRVTFLHMSHTDSRTTVVEFKDFLLVIDAPKSSRNGQLILDKITEMEYGKPVKLFAFGHHHPHYLGGVRPFVATGAKVLTTKKIVPYLKQLVSFKHSSPVDALQSNPKDLLVQEFEGQVTLTDGEYEVRVFDMGLRSHHTIDYLLFYFPKEKMVLQGDGVNVKVGSPPSKRTRGVYEELKKLDLDVVDCIQGWPTQNYGVRTKIKFSELKSYVEDFDAKQSLDTQLSQAEVFERLKKLAGKWKHESKNERIEYELISRDSVLVENWSWPDRKRSGMTVYHMDGEKLMATHYCPAGNQPRLLFDSVNEDGSAVFNFASATNLPDKGKSHCVSFWLRQKGDVLKRSESYADKEGVDITESRYLRVKD